MITACAGKSNLWQRNSVWTGIVPTAYEECPPGSRKEVWSWNSTFPRRGIKSLRSGRSRVRLPQTGLRNRFRSAADAALNAGLNDLSIPRTPSVLNSKGLAAINRHLGRNRKLVLFVGN